MRGGWIERALLVLAVAACGDSSSTGDGGHTGTQDPNIVECTPEGWDHRGTNPEEKGGIDGTNGLFVDHCTEDGHLLDYICALECLEYDEPPNPVCIEWGPGEAVEIFYDCVGQCVDGTCDGRCPDFGHRLEILTISGESSGFENLDDGRRYACTLSWDQTDDTFDCATDLSVGQTVEITTLGVSGYCTGAEWGSFGIGDPQTCTFGCDIDP
jgi:hypothetical protein